MSVLKRRAALLLVFALLLPPAVVSAAPPPRVIRLSGRYPALLHTGSGHGRAVTLHPSAQPPTRQAAVTTAGTTIQTFFLPYQPGGRAVPTRLPHVAVDAAGGIHTVYAAGSADITGRRPAYYAYCPPTTIDHCASAADYQVVSFGDQMSHAQIALDPQGHPRLLLTAQWPDQPIIYQYAACNVTCTTPANWTVATVASGDPPFFPSHAEDVRYFALDPQGRPRFVFYANAFGTTSGGTIYAACDTTCTTPANWTGTYLTNGEWKNPALSFTPGGAARLAIHTYDSSTFAPLIGYLECASACTNGANWQGIVLLGTATTGAMSDSTFALTGDATGHPRMVVYPGTGSGGALPPNRLYYLWCDTSCLVATNWFALDISGTDRDGEQGVDLVLDRLGHPRVAYRMPAPTDELAYTQCDTACTTAANWMHTMVPSTAAAQQEYPILPPPGCSTAFWDAGYWPSLALDPSGAPRIGFDLEHWRGGSCTAGVDVRLARLAVLPAPAVTLSPTSLAFGNQLVTTASTARAVTLRNTGNATLTIGGIAFAGTNPGDFSRTTTCGATLAAGASCTITVTFKPTGIGTRSATLRVTTNAAGSPHSVTVSGVGTTLSVTPGSIAFGSQVVGTTSTARTISVRNAGTATLTITGISFIGTNVGDFAKTTTCGTSLAVGASCTIAVTFKPAAIGTRTAQVRIDDTAVGSPHSVALSGIGTTLGVAPTSIVFGSQIVGTTSAIQTVTLSNRGTTALTITSVTLGGTNPADFAKTTSCTTSLAAGASCTFGVTFRPTVAAARSATLNIVDTAAGSPHTVALSGTGTP